MYVCLCTNVLQILGIKEAYLYVDYYYVQVNKVMIRMNTKQAYFWTRRLLKARECIRITCVDVLNDIIMVHPLVSGCRWNLTCDTFLYIATLATENRHIQIGRLEIAGRERFFILEECPAAKSLMEREEAKTVLYEIVIGSFGSKIDWFWE